jgi:CPA2 family monovalent cation:H+ antiporter-2
LPETRDLRDVLVLLAALVAFVPLFNRLRLGPVVGYLSAGVVIGPSVLGLVEHLDAFRALAHFGVVFLLFNIGLELKLERLRVLGWRAYGLAAAQIVITAAAFWAASRLLGLGVAASTVVGLALSISSTAVVLEGLRGLGLVTSRLGRTAVAILLVQDLAVGPFLVVVQALAAGGGGVLWAPAVALAKAVVVLGFIVAGERLVLRPLLRLAAGSGVPEVFVGCVLLVVLGTSWASEAAGLSMAFGAFLAGLMMADTEYQHQVVADIQPFRGLLLGLFFMTVGMTIDAGFVAGEWGSIVLAVAALIGVKGILLAGLALGAGLPSARALQLGALLAQGSEFAFVLLGSAMALGLVDGPAGQRLVAAVAASMALTALALALAPRLFEARGGGPRAALGDLDRQAEEFRDHVVIVAFGQVGKAVARHLTGEHVPVLVLDLDVDRVSAGRARKLPVFYGDAERAAVLRSARLERARALVVAVPDGDAAQRITRLARGMYSELRIFARCPDEESVPRLRDAGADAVAVEGLTTALELAERAIVA